MKFAKRGRGNRGRSSRAQGLSGPEITRSEVASLLSDGLTYAGQQYEVVKLPGQTTSLTTTVTTGVATFSHAPNLGTVQGTARFTAMWDEYRIIDVVYELYPIVVSTGVMSFWFDEKSSSTGTANEAQQRNARRFLNTNASDRGIVKMRWQPRDLGDLEYTDTGTLTTNKIYFKGYTDAASWGAPIAATLIWVYRPILTVEFRGLKST